MVGRFRLPGEICWSMVHPEGDHALSVTAFDRYVRDELFWDDQELFGIQDEGLQSRNALANLLRATLSRISH
jgi:hypothetical protein